MWPGVWALVRDSLMDGLTGHRAVRELAPVLERAVAGGSVPAAVAAQRILARVRRIR